MAIKLTWFGHATMQLDVNGTKLLVDPFFSGNPAASTTADKVAADYILITHGHGDHVGDAERAAEAVAACGRHAPGRAVSRERWSPAAG